MVLGMRECCLFFSQSRELGAGPLHFEECSLESPNFHVLYEVKPQCEFNPVLVPGKSKHTNNKINTVQLEFNSFPGIAIAFCFIQAAWCSHATLLNSIKYAEQSTASRDCYRSHATIKFLISDYYGVHMLLFPCHLHRKYVFGDSVPKGK